MSAVFSLALQVEREDDHTFVVRAPFLIEPLRGPTFEGIYAMAMRAYRQVDRRTLGA
jgi:hypothetical protein